MRDVRLPAPSKLSLKLINARTRNRVNKCTSSMVFTVMSSHSSRMFITNINMPKRPTYCPMATASQLRVSILRAKWWSTSRQIQQQGHKNIPSHHPLSSLSLFHPPPPTNLIPTPTQHLQSHKQHSDGSI